jgi:hypothetical protein
MAGELKIANDAVTAAIAEVTASPALTEIGVLNTQLNAVLTKLMITNSYAEWLNPMDFLLDSQNQDAIVAVRGG